MKLKVARAALLGAAITFAGVTIATVKPVFANHCDNLAGLPNDWCHSSTPKPTSPPQPTLAPPPTQAPPSQPTAAPRPRQPVRSSAPGEPIVAQPSIDPAQQDPLGTPEIVVTEPLATPESESIELAQDAPGGTGPAHWAFFVVGLVVGGLIGRASWGLQRKRRSNLFG